MKKMKINGIQFGIIMCYLHLLAGLTLGCLGIINGGMGSVMASAIVFTILSTVGFIVFRDR